MVVLENCNLVYLFYKIEKIKLTSQYTSQSTNYMEEKLNKSSHILNASSNLVGFCFIVLTSLTIFQKNSLTFIDECTTLALIMFVFSTLFSFLSIRSNNKRRSNIYERIADIIFLVGLLSLLVTILLITFNVIT